MAKQQTTISFKIDDVSYVIEMQNSKRILEVVKNLNIPNPDIQEILNIFDKYPILVDRSFQKWCTLENAILKLKSKSLNPDILNNQSFNKFLLQESQCKSTLESLYNECILVDDSSSDSPNFTSDASNLMGAVSSDE